MDNQIVLISERKLDKVLDGISFVIATTSILSNPDMDEVRKSRIVENFVPKESQTEKKVIEDQKEELRKEIFEQRLKDIKLLPKETKGDKDEFERCKTAFIIDFHKEFGKELMNRIFKQIKVMKILIPSKENLMKNCLVNFHR